jgi:nucleotide-binding universal stress UspA family protein
MPHKPLVRGPAAAVTEGHGCTGGTGLRGRHAEIALERVEAGAEQARHAGFQAVARSNVVAPTWEGIVEEANEVDAAVIVIGSHGRNAGPSSCTGASRTW